VRLSRFAVGMYVFAALSGLIAVSLMAFTSHGLLEAAPTGEQAVTWFKIATSWQMDHTLALILVTAIADQLGGRAQQLMRIAAVLMAAGALLFPTALYSLSFHGPSFFAPWGGFAAMAGWVLFGVGALLALKQRI
jgi:uncharacterized membrane protein YgdD (TMEM256/DUF423 family)